MDAPVWIFDLDDTLHDASWKVFPRMSLEMTAYIARHLGVDETAADRLRIEFWRRHGATLLGLMREHGVRPGHFLAETHRMPDLASLLRADRGQLAALRRLPGRRLLLTNAPRAYALRVLEHCGLRGVFDDVVAVEQMWQFRTLRPKPDARMLRHVLRRLRLRPQACILVEDSLDNLRAARRAGLRGVWYTRYVSRAARACGARTRAGRPCFVHARIRSLWQLPIPT